jgi:hypothetical protein
MTPSKPVITASKLVIMPGKLVMMAIKLVMIAVGWWRIHFLSDVSSKCGWN